jgi:hypothetical protein
MKRRSLVLVLRTCAAAAALVAGCSSAPSGHSSATGPATGQPATSESTPVGVVGPYSGPGGPTTGSSKLAIEAWADAANAAGGNGHHVQLYLEDDAGNPSTKSLADELGPHGINVTVLYPGHTLSNTYEKRLAAEAAERGLELADYLATIDTGTAIGRFIRPEEIGWVAVFLASPRSITISGDVITVGGGFLGGTYY